MPHANDNHADAIELTGASGAITPFHYDGVGDPAGNEGGESYFGAGETLWWKWTSPFTGTAVFTTTGSTSDDDDPVGLDTKMQVFEGAWNGTRVARNDDDDTATDTFIYNSRCEFEATGGTTYFIQVDQYSDSQAGVLHLSWIASAATFAVSYVDCPAYAGLGHDVLVPGPGVNVGVAHGLHIDLIETVTFTGGGTATVDDGWFELPLDLSTVRSGRAVFSGGGQSQSLDIIMLKPETPGYDRDFDPRSVSSSAGWLAAPGGRPGAYVTEAFADNDPSSGVSYTGNGHDATYYAESAYWSSGTLLPGNKRLGMVSVRVGWAAGPDGGMNAEHTAPGDVPPPSGETVYAIDRQDLGFDSIFVSLPFSDITLGTFSILGMKVQAHAVENRTWSNFTAEIYAVPAADLVSSEVADIPELGPSLSDGWLPPLWFEDHTPLATHDFGFFGRGPAASEVAELYFDVPHEYVWHGEGDNAYYTYFVIIPQVYRLELDDELPGQIFEIAPWFWEVMPARGSDSFAVSFQSSEVLPAYDSVRLGIQYEDATGNFITGYYEAVTYPGSSDGLHSHFVTLPSGMQPKQVWVEFLDVSGGTWATVLNWDNTIGTYGNIRFQPDDLHDSVGTTSSFTSEPLWMHLTYQEQPYRFWLPEAPVMTQLLRQVGRPDRSRQYPRAAHDGTRQVGQIP